MPRVVYFALSVGIFFVLPGDVNAGSEVHASLQVSADSRLLLMRRQEEDLMPVSLVDISTSPSGADEQDASQGDKAAMIRLTDWLEKANSALNEPASLSQGAAGGGTSAGAGEGAGAGAGEGVAASASHEKDTSGMSPAEVKKAEEAEAQEQAIAKQDKLASSGDEKALTSLAARLRKDNKSAAAKGDLSALSKLAAQLRTSSGLAAVSLPPLPTQSPDLPDEDQAASGDDTALDKLADDLLVHRHKAWDFPSEEDAKSKPTVTTTTDSPGNIDLAVDVPRIHHWENSSEPSSQNSSELYSRPATQGAADSRHGSHEFQSASRTARRHNHEHKHHQYERRDSLDDTVRRPADSLDDTALEHRTMGKSNGQRGSHHRHHSGHVKSSNNESLGASSVEQVGSEGQADNTPGESTMGHSLSFQEEVQKEVAAQLAAMTHGKKYTESHVETKSVEAPSSTPGPTPDPFDVIRASRLEATKFVKKLQNPVKIREPSPEWEKVIQESDHALDSTKNLAGDDQVDVTTTQEPAAESARPEDRTISKVVQLLQGIIKGGKDQSTDASPSATQRLVEALEKRAGAPNSESPSSTGALTAADRLAQADSADTDSAATLAGDDDEGDATSAADIASFGAPRGSAAEELAEAMHNSASNDQGATAGARLQEALEKQAEND